MCIYAITLLNLTQSCHCRINLLQLVLFFITHNCCKKKYYRTHPSVFKLVQLLCTENFKDLCNLGIFLIYILKTPLTLD